MDNTETHRAGVGDTEEKVEGSSPKVSQPEAVKSRQDLKEEVGHLDLMPKDSCTSGADWKRDAGSLCLFLTTACESVMTSK